MRISYHNYIDDVASVSSIVVSTENVIYPKDNLLDQRLSQEYRTTAVTSQTVTIDLGSALSINTAAIISHNISSSATIVVDANSSNSWPGATSETLTFNANMILKFFSTDKTYRYWQFKISDPSNTNGYLSIGRLWLGDYISIDPSALLDFKIIKKRNDLISYGEGRQKFSTPGVGWRRFEFNFPRSSYTMIKKIEDMYDEVGNHSSIIFCNFNTDRSYQIVEPCYCSIANDGIEFDHWRSMKFTYSLALEEDL